MSYDREEKIQKRAYEIWEREGRTGDPEDHWLRAERELHAGTQDTSAIAAEDVLPDDAVAAADSAIR